MENEDQKIVEFDRKIKEAEENSGDAEIRDAILEKAEYFEKQGNLVEACKEYERALLKAFSVQKRLEIVFFIMKIKFENGELDEVKKLIEKSKVLLEEGGDWERRNKLKVYEGIYLLVIRDFKKASPLLLESLSTFNSQEFISFDKIVFYSVILGIVTLKRSELKEKVIHSSEILSSIRDIPNLKLFLDSFYKCDYKQFFVSLLSIIPQIESDKDLKTHKKFLIKQLRIRAYEQYLESFKTVKLSSMASAFGVSVDFIDREISDLIASRKIFCKIDKVAGIIEYERVDERNRLYKETFRNMDFLLNKIQKLSRVIEL